MEHGITLDSMLRRFFFTPVPCAFITGLIQRLSITLGAEGLFNGDMIIDKKMSRHIEHGKTVRHPYAGVTIDFYRYLRCMCCHDSVSPQTVRRRSTQLSPMIFWVCRSLKPPCKSASVRLGNSPSV